MYPTTDKPILKIELSVFDKSLNLSVIDGVSCFLTKISAQTARELAESIQDILEELPDTMDHSTQTVLPFNAHQEAA